MTPIFIMLVVFSLTYQNGHGKARVDPLVHTNVGLIRGLQAGDGDYSMFLGIPYGKVNETNPFGPSVPYPKFDDVFEAYDDSAICPQLEDFNNTIVGSLDCLHLNVYVPRTATSQNLLPVMVYIYGGGFARGFASRYIYGPKYLVRHDVILVILNYRLGPYGFMCLDTPEVSGNQGFKDQLLALRWVKENIESFGGDVNKITIFGESAGGISVDLHLYSEQEKLFNRVIMQSGTSLMIQLVKEADRTAPVKLAEQLGFVTEDFTEALKFLSTVDPKLIIAAASKIERFITCVEKEFDGVERFLTDYSDNKNIPKAKNTDILIGFNSNEMSSNYAIEKPDFFVNNEIFNDSIKDLFTFNETQLREMEEIVRHFYIGDQKISQNVKFELSDFTSDVKYNHPAERSIAKYLENGAEKVFYYVFSYNGARNFYQRKNNNTVKGAAHADEISYLFDVSFMTEVPSTEDQLTIDRMTTMWANFAKYGDPTPDTSELLPVKWESVTKNSAYNYLDIDAEITLGKKPYHQRMSFWDLFYKANGKYLRGYKGGDEN